MGEAVRGGGCLCGAIRFEARGEPGKPHTCSCRICQKHSGALTLAWVEYARDAVSWTGPGAMPALYRSSDHSSRAFCRDCGSTLGAIDDEPVVGLLAGSFDQPARRRWSQPPIPTEAGGRIGGAWARQAILMPTTSPEGVRPLGAPRPPSPADRTVSPPDPSRGWPSGSCRTSRRPRRPRRPRR